MALVERDEVWVSVHKSDVEMKIKIVNFNLAHSRFTKAIKIQPSLFLLRWFNFVPLKKGGNDASTFPFRICLN